MTLIAQPARFNVQPPKRPLVTPNEFARYLPLPHLRQSNEFHRERHLAKLHPELSREEFLMSMAASLREGVARLEVSGQRFKGITGTKLLAEARKSGSSER